MAVLLAGGSQGKTEKMSTTEIDELLTHVKVTFSDVLISMEYIVKQDLLGKGNWTVSQI